MTRVPHVGREAASTTPRDAGAATPPSPEPDVLGGLIRLVTSRARRLGELREPPRDGTADPLEELREAVEALTHVLDALALLRRAGGAASAPRPASPLDATDASRAPEGSGRAPTPDTPTAGPATRDRRTSGADVRADVDEHGVRLDDDGGALPDPLPYRRSGPARARSPAWPEPIVGTEPAGGGSPPPAYPPFRDQTTGLYSREGLETIAGAELKRCIRHERLFSVLLIHLPALRESSLKRAARTIRAGLRESDVAGREADDVVAVALPEARSIDARVVAERLVSRLESSGLWGAGSGFGLATHPDRGETLWALLEAARGDLRRSRSTADAEGPPGTNGDGTDGIDAGRIAPGPDGEPPDPTR